MFLRRQKTFAAAKVQQKLHICKFLRIFLRNFLRMSEKSSTFAAGFEKRA
jgi:hypothetical protein